MCIAQSNYPASRSWLPRSGLGGAPSATTSLVGDSVPPNSFTRVCQTGRPPVASTPPCLCPAFCPAFAGTRLRNHNSSSAELNRSYSAAALFDATTLQTWRPAATGNPSALARFLLPPLQESGGGVVVCASGTKRDPRIRDGRAGAPGLLRTDRLRGGGRKLQCGKAGLGPEALLHPGEDLWSADVGREAGLGRVREMECQDGDFHYPDMARKSPKDLRVNKRSNYFFFFFLTV